MARRIVIVGGPHVGKTTLSEKLKAECGFENAHHSDDIKHLDWSESSEFASYWFDSEDDYVAEGVQMARALRKWLDRNPGKPLDADIVWLTTPQTALLKGQVSMAKGVMTVLSEIRGELEKRGARIHHLRDPQDAIDMFKSASPTIPIAEGEAGMQLELTKEQFDAMPEGLQKACSEQDGKYTLDFETADQVKGLKTALDKRTKAEKEAKEAKDALEAKFAGVDLEKWNQYQTETENKETDELKRKGMVEELITKGKEREAKINQEWQKKYDDLQAKHDSLRIDHRLRAAFEAGGVIPDRIDDAVDLTKKRVKLTETDAQILDDDGSPMDASIEIYAKELLKEKKPWLYAASTAAGTGASPNGKNLGPPGVDLSKLPPTERLKLANRQEAAK